MRFEGRPARRLARGGHARHRKYAIRRKDGRGLLRTILITCTGLRFAIDHVDIERDGRLGQARDQADFEGTEIASAPSQTLVVLCLEVKGKRPISHLIARLSDIEGVVSVGTAEAGLDLD